MQTKPFSKVVEVFKTDVQDSTNARKFVEHIRQCYPGFKVNFDLHDCDRILRVESHTGPVPAAELITLLREKGCDAEVLPDTIPEMVHSMRELEAWLQNV